MRCLQLVYAYIVIYILNVHGCQRPCNVGDRCCVVDGCGCVAMIGDDGPSLCAPCVPEQEIVIETPETNMTANDVVGGVTLDVRVGSEQGFGDLDNVYAWSMDVFKGKLYVGTLNAIFPLIGLPKFFLGLDFASEGAQIWRGTVDSSEPFGYKWSRVVVDGRGNMNNYGIRKLQTVGNYLYGVTGNHNEGFELWRTRNGINWETIISDGFGNTNSKSGRGLMDYKGYFYVGVENRNTGAKIYRRRIKSNGDFRKNSNWQEVVSAGFGNRFNWWVSDFVIYNDYLYVGTLNPGGFQLYRTCNGIRYDQVIFRGNTPNGTLSFDSASMRMTVYNNRLYIGTMNFFSGASLLVNTDTEGLEFEFLFINGNGNSANAYVWQLQVYNNRLYVGTFDTSRQFDLFSAEGNIDNSTVWDVETENAFGFVGHYGIRTMSVWNNKLMFGTASYLRNKGAIVFEGTAKNLVVRPEPPILPDEGEVVPDAKTDVISLDKTIHISFDVQLIYIYIGVAVLIGCVCCSMILFFCYLKSNSKQYKRIGVQTLTTDKENLP